MQDYLIKTGAKLESAINLVSMIVPTIPASIRKLQGKLIVNKTMLANEIERMSFVRPSILKLHGHNSSATPHKTLLAFFVKASRPDFRVFDESGLAIPH